MAKINNMLGQIKEKAGSLTNKLTEGIAESQMESGTSLRELNKSKESLIREKQKYFGYLGMAVYDAHMEKDMEFQEFSMELGKIKKISADIAELDKLIKIKEQERTMSGKNVCQNCGAKLSAGAKFCAECGTVVKGDTIICHCSVPVKRSIKFCQNCGTSVEILLREEQQRENLENAAMEEEKVCICGAKIGMGQFMCMECGRKVMD